MVGSPEEPWKYIYFNQLNLALKSSLRSQGVPATVMAAACHPVMVIAPACHPVTVLAPECQPRCLPSCHSAWSNNSTCFTHSCCASDFEVVLFAGDAHTQRNVGALREVRVPALMQGHTDWHLVCRNKQDNAEICVRQQKDGWVCRHV